MSIVYLLLPIGIVMMVLGIAWFVWSVRHGQYDDLETPPVRILFDDTRREDVPEERRDPEHS